MEINTKLEFESLQESEVIFDETDNDLMAREDWDSESVPARACRSRRSCCWSAFSPHDLLHGVYQNTLAGYPCLEDQNLDDLTLELLYPTDEAAEHCIKSSLALRLDDDNEHELEQ